MKLTNLGEAFVEELKDVYSAEGQLTKALPKLIKAVGCENLRKGLEAHLKETENHVKRLEKVFKLLNEPLKAKKCEAMAGLIEEGGEAIAANTDHGDIRDAMIIVAAQKVEHYEIAAYGALKSWATELGHDDVAQLLNETLDEEKAADRKLNDLATSKTNPAACQCSEDGEEADKKMAGSKR